MNQQLKEFLAGYITALVWSTSCDFEFSQEAHDRCANDCSAFMETNDADLALYVEQIETVNCSPWEHAGHDFWLTRAGHGVGFWDRGLDELGDRLTSACKVSGQVWPYVGDDGKVYLS